MRIKNGTIMTFNISLSKFFTYFYDLFFMLLFANPSKDMMWFIDHG